MNGNNSDNSAGLIQVKRLSKSFGTRTALSEIDLDVMQGESVVIFGPNGAGKSTFIRILATITGLSSGYVEIDGLDIKKNAEKVRQKIGIVTHQTFLYNNLTAYENLEFYSRMYDVPERKERILEVAARVGMTSRLHDRVSTLSRGMQQRFAIARALLHKPPVMLLDEPETGLDQSAMTMLWSVLKDENDGKRCIIITTHNLERGLQLGDRLVILNRGRITWQMQAQDVNLSELRDSYEEYTGALS